MSYDVTNVIHVIMCNGCGEYDIGHTGDKLRTRRDTNAQQIRDPSVRQIPLSGHLDTVCNSKQKFKMFPFYKMKTDTVADRLPKENHFIKYCKPVLNASS